MIDVEEIFVPIKGDPDVSVELSLASKASSGYDTGTQGTNGTLESRGSSRFSDSFSGHGDHQKETECLCHPVPVTGQANQISL